jgi:hypothetical protein
MGKVCSGDCGGREKGEIIACMTSLHGETLLPQLRTCLDASDDEGVVRLVGALNRTRQGRLHFRRLDKGELLAVLDACRRHDLAVSGGERWGASEAV